MWASGFVLWNVETLTLKESVAISWKESISRPPPPSPKYGHTHSEIHNNTMKQLNLEPDFGLEADISYFKHFKFAMYQNIQWPKSLNCASKCDVVSASCNVLPTFEVACCRAARSPSWRQQHPPPPPPVIFTILLPPHLSILFFHWYLKVKHAHPHPHVRN